RHTRFSRDWSSDVCSSDLALLPDPRDKSIVILNPLPTTRNLTVAFRRQEVHRERNFGVQRIRLVIERLRLLRISRHKERPIEMRSEERRVGKECRERR